MIQWVGPLGALLTTVAFLPQVIQVVKTKDVSSISFIMYVIFVLGVILWTLYGIILHDMTIILSNGITSILASVILYMKWKSMK